VERLRVPPLGAMAGGLDVVFVGGLINKLTGVFVVAPEIKGPAKLKGKTIKVASVVGSPVVNANLSPSSFGSDELGPVLALASR